MNASVSRICVYYDIQCLTTKIAHPRYCRPTRMKCEHSRDPEGFNGDSRQELACTAGGCLGSDPSVSVGTGISIINEDRKKEVLCKFQGIVSTLHMLRVLSTYLLLVMVRKEKPLRQAFINTATKLTSLKPPEYPRFREQVAFNQSARSLGAV